jgi:hypothetical protein
MDHADPLKLCADLNAIFRRQAGGWLDSEHFAEQLFSHRDRRSDVLREQVLLSLESIERRSA